MLDESTQKKTSLWIKIILNSFLVSFIIAFGLTVYLFILSKDLPSLDELEKFNPEQVTKVISSDGVVIKKLYTYKRDMIEVSSIPITLRNALMCMEDRDFYEQL